MDTIFALATAPGKAGVSVVRVSGDLAWDAAARLAGALPQPRSFGLRRLRAADGGLIDQALVLVFDQGESFTGERVVEFQTHGSVSVVSALMRELGNLDGLRLAEPGEFTRRAFENGALDITQVEALSDLIEAETESQRRQAIGVLEGSFRDIVRQWRNDLVRAAALLEAVIDFADEEVPEDVSGEVRDLIVGVRGGIEGQLRGLSSAERIRDGFEVAIVGRPNVGKSTLLNYLAGRRAAITSDMAGTTRDVIEVRMDIGGLAVTFLDTAGLRETEETVESLGIALARERADAADLRVHLVTADGGSGLDLRDDDIVVTARVDETSSSDGVSGVTGQGVQALLDRIQSALGQRAARAGLASRERHRKNLDKAGGHLERALDILEAGSDLYDLASEEIRGAARSLETLIGLVDVEHLLDEIFANFCVGK